MSVNLEGWTEQGRNHFSGAGISGTIREVRAFDCDGGMYVTEYVIDARINCPHRGRGGVCEVVIVSDMPAAKRGMRTLQARAAAAKAARNMAPDMGYLRS